MAQETTRQNLNENSGFMDILSGYFHPIKTARVCRYGLPVNNIEEAVRKTGLAEDEGYKDLMDGSAKYERAVAYADRRRNETLLRIYVTETIDGPPKKRTIKIGKREIEVYEEGKKREIGRTFVIPGLF